MKNLIALRILIFILVTFFYFFSIITNSYAHSGNTDSLGCHTCYTNCSSYGLYYGEYHCHNPKTYYTPPPSCPLNSYYDSLSSSCKCYSGYVSNGSSCISNLQYCWNNYGYSSTYDYSTGGCKCSYGNVLSSGKCISGSSYCWNNYGYNSQYDSLNKTCECSYGYVWNQQGSSCISQDEACRNQLGIMSKYNSLYKNCECFSGYTIQSGRCQVEIIKTNPIIFNKPKTYVITPTKTQEPTATPKESNQSNDNIEKIITPTLDITQFNSEPKQNVSFVSFMIDKIGGFISGIVKTFFAN